MCVVLRLPSASERFVSAGAGQGYKTSGLPKNDATNMGCMETWKQAWNDARTRVGDAWMEERN